MHGAHEFLEALTLVLCVAVVTSAVCYRLRQPVVLGYIMAGLIIGPYVPIPLVAEQKIVESLSELGVILLMFSLGLEFSLRKLASVGPTASVTAVFQCSIMMWLGFVTGQLLGWTTSESIFAGAIIAISSTTIIAKTFDDLGVRGALRELVVGVLVVEDLIAILLLAVLTAVFTGAGVSAEALATTTARLAAFLVGLVVVGLLVIPRALRAISRQGRSETLLIASVAICFAVSVLAQKFGYSVALGAFIAGSLVAESGQEKIIEPLIQPLRDLFAAIFFVSVGMLIDPAAIAEHWAAIAALTLIAIVGKVASVTVGALLAGSGVNLAVRSGMSLAQIGEFSFIIAGLGLTLGATRNFVYTVAVAVSAITTLTTPWLVEASGPVAQAAERRLPRRIQTFMALYTSWLEDLRRAPRVPERGAVVRSLLTRLALDVALLAAIAVGTSLWGDQIVAVLEQRLALPALAARFAMVLGATLLAVPFILGLVQLTRRLGLVLAEAALGQAREGQLDLAAAPRGALVVMLELMMALLIGTVLLAITQPFLPGPQGVVALGLIVAALAVLLWRRMSDLQGHVRAGAEMIVEVLAKQTSDRSTTEDPLHRVRDMLRGLGAPQAVVIGPNSPAAGKTLAQVDVTGRTEATVLAIIRGERGTVVPSEDEVLRSGDVIVLAGGSDAVVAAKQLLTGESAQSALAAS